MSATWSTGPSDPTSLQPLAPLAATLDNCSSEPIHIPGAIQPHGGMVAFSPGAGTVLHASTNLGDWLAVDHLPARGRSLAALFGDGACERLLQALTVSAGGSIRHQIVDLPARPDEGQNAALEVVVHEHRGVCFAELETACAAPEQLDWMQLFGDTVDALRKASDLEDLVERIARRIKRLTGFDRVMVYRFDEDWNGHVIADAHERGMESFYDLHYPASDIPAQARELFRSNLVRYIADVGYTPVPVLPWLDAERQQPLDMSHAVLRSASPIHIQYLHNMGVGATLTISLLVEDRLWGLIACHHRLPHTATDRLPVRLRRACHALSVTASYMVDWHLQRQRAAEVTALALAKVRVMEAFNHVQASLPDVVEQCSAALLRIARCGGGALWRDGVVLPFGQWPGGEQGEAILRFVRHALETSTADILHTDSAFLPAAGPVGASNEPIEPTDAPDGICGYLAVRLDAFASSGIVWVRGALRREVSWGGDPDKPVQMSYDALGRPSLSPRTSFARWTALVKGQSSPWTDLDVGAARSLQGLNQVLTVRDSLAHVSLSEQRFRSLVALQSDAYCQLDTEGRIITLSKPLPGGQPIAAGTTLVALLAPACDLAEVDALGSAIECRRPFHDLRLHGRATDGHPAFVVDVSGEALKDQQGVCIGWHGTVTDATLQVAAQTAVRLKETAEMSSLAKSKFLSQMSHELRTPLNAVIGFSQLLLMDSTISTPQHQKLQHIHRAGQWLLEMITDLMDLSRAESGQLSLQLEAVDAMEAIAQAISLVEVQAASGGMHLISDDRGDPVWVLADPSRLRQVFANLASNAIKYNRPGGDVHFTMAHNSAGNTVSIEVRDTGAGLTADQVGQLFQPFNRLGREKQRIQGTGIGLVIAKQLVEAMGGHIVATSRLGEGSVFTVTLAMAQPGINRVPQDPIEVATLEAQRVVLYVGDDASNVILMQSIIDSLPAFRLAHTETAESALEMSRLLNPIMVLIDVKIAGLPGMHLLKSIKADPALHHIRCIAVDADSGSAAEDLERLQLAGFEDRWSKPIDLKSIWSALGVALGH